MVVFLGELQADCVLRCGVCVTYLADEHASCHGEPGAGGEVGGDHDTQSGLREGQFVRVEDEELVHHDDWRRLLTMGLACGRSVKTYNKQNFIYIEHTF